MTLWLGVIMCTTGLVLSIYFLARYIEKLDQETKRLCRTNEELTNDAKIKETISNLSLDDARQRMRQSIRKSSKVPNGD